MYDVIIIGAGFSGLGAALKLKQEGKENFLILEARDRVGGRTKPGKLAGLDIDLGGMWLSPTQTRLKHYSEKYNIETYSTYLEGKGIFESHGKVIQGKREKIDPMFSVLEGLDYLKTRWKLSRLAKDLDCDNPWHHPQAKALDGMTLESWIQKNIRSKKIISLFQQVCYAIFCAEADQISMLFFIHYIKSGDGFDKIISADRGGAQNFLFKGGLHQISVHMAKEVESQLRLNSPAQTIEWTQSGATITAGNQTYQTRSVIFALPPTMVPSLNFEPELPSPKKALHSTLSMGSAIKFWVAYEKPFWREQGLNGLIFSDRFPCTPMMDASPPNQPLGILAGFFDGDHAITHGDLTSEERQKIVTSAVAYYYGSEGHKVVDYQDINWNKEEWSEGCYGAYSAPGTYARYGEWLRKPIGPLFWAGTETSPRWTGYVDGAIRSGERAATEAIKEIAKPVAVDTQTQKVHLVS